MIFKNKYIILLLLLATIVILSLNLRNQNSQKIIKNDFELLNEKYYQQKNLIDQQILFKRFILTEGLNSYNPALKDYNMDTLRLNELIKSKALVYRFTIGSCSSCVEKKIEYYFDHRDLIKHQFIVLCTNEQIFSKLSRTYKYNDLNFFLIENDTLNDTSFNDLFSSLYFIIGKNGNIITTIFPDNIEEFYDIL